MGTEYDPDDVADMVAHDAAVGLPGFTEVPAYQQIGTLAWADRMVRSASGETGRAVQAVCNVAVMATATTLHHLGPDLTRQQLLEGVLDDFLDVTHGLGTADEVHAVMSWWQSLTAEEQSLTGVQLTTEPDDEDGEG